MKGKSTYAQPQWFLEIRTVHQVSGLITEAVGGDSHRTGATHLHSALLCRNELHWSGRFVSLDMDSSIEMICLNDGRF